MGYHNSNAAYAYDMQADSHAPYEYAPSAPATVERPRLDVVAGAGREANQEVSPVFTHVIKVFCALAVTFVLIGLARVTVAGLTAATLNANAGLTSSLEAAQEQSADLEVMRSVYGAHTRVRDLAAGTLGMVDAEGGVVLDFTQDAPVSPSAQ